MTQLEIFAGGSQHSESNVADVQLSGIVDFSRKQTKPVLSLMSEVGLLLKLVLVMPATNACSERSFSVLHLIKSYPRSTMMQQRLNHLMVLSVHKEFTDKLSLIDVANEFISGSEHRKNVFSMEFSQSDK